MYRYGASTSRPPCDRLGTARRDRSGIRTLFQFALLAHGLAGLAIGGEGGVEKSVVKADS